MLVAIFTLMTLITVTIISKLSTHAKAGTKGKAAEKNAEQQVIDP
ncbi:hypothetical protein [Bacillus sp. ISL-34]|nr:hypothetical protein [Bacillus sp. ISL-34]